MLANTRRLEVLDNSSVTDAERSGGGSEDLHSPTEGSRADVSDTASDADGLKRVFGVALPELLKCEGTALPSLVQECTRHVQERAPSDVTLVTADGDPSVVLTLRKAFERSTDVGQMAILECIDSSSDADVRAVCSLLRSFLLELPQPVVPVQFFLPLLEAMRASKGQCDGKQLEAILAPMAHEHWAVLEHMLCFLVNVSRPFHDRAAKQLLARVWAPCMLRAPARTMSQFQGRVIDTMAACVTALLTLRSAEVGIGAQADSIGPMVHTSGGSDAHAQPTTQAQGSSNGDEEEPLIQLSEPGAYGASLDARSDESMPNPLPLAPPQGDDWSILDFSVPDEEALPSELYPAEVASIDSESDWHLRRAAEAPQQQSPSSRIAASLMELSTPPSSKQALLSFSCPDPSTSEFQPASEAQLAQLSQHQPVNLEGRDSTRQEMRHQPLWQPEQPKELLQQCYSRPAWPQEIERPAPAMQPLPLMHTSPSAPTVRGGRDHLRGADDDTASVSSHLSAQSSQRVAVAATAALEAREAEAARLKQKAQRLLRERSQLSCDLESLQETLGRMQRAAARARDQVQALRAENARRTPADTRRHTAQLNTLSKAVLREKQRRLAARNQAGALQRQVAKKRQHLECLSMQLAPLKQQQNDVRGRQAAGESARQQARECQLRLAECQRELQHLHTETRQSCAVGPAVAPPTSTPPLEMHLADLRQRVATHPNRSRSAAAAQQRQLLLQALATEQAGPVRSSTIGGGLPTAPMQKWEELTSRLQGALQQVSQKCGTPARVVPAYTSRPALTEAAKWHAEARAFAAEARRVERMQLQAARDRDAQREGWRDFQAELGRSRSTAATEKKNAMLQHDLYEAQATAAQAQATLEGLRQDEHSLQAELEQVGRRLALLQELSVQLGAHAL